ncbi:MAG: tRNA (adenosine(37)-N6)-threonylcarbamoyltransferase complex dimerization subunit type 1 TsaB, partial [Bacteroidales bacterium]|nr:tRNA (adenosine(37)-N6)-threonylcarbamoyltransferase complex dimerization subunit type 1 TsaB [Bacteroidales bacterium]
VYLPMIDARRMEVYTSLFDKDLNRLKDISADIVEQDIYKDYPYEKIILVGNGSEKCKTVLTDSRYVFDKDIYLSAKDMAQESCTKYNNGEFEDTAYFEPYYLKEFIAVKSKVKGLYDNK